MSISVFLLHATCCCDRHLNGSALYFVISSPSGQSLDHAVTADDKQQYFTDSAPRFIIPFLNKIVYSMGFVKKAPEQTLSPEPLIHQPHCCK